MFFFNDTATTEIYTLSLHDALPISQVLVADALATGQEPIVELHPLLVYVAGDVLEPLGRVAGRALQLEHRAAPLFLVVLQRGLEIVMLVQLLGEPHRILQRQLRARA